MKGDKSGRHSKRVRNEEGGNFACGFAARENSLAGVARQGVSGFGAKSFARAPTPASYAG